MDEHVIAYVTVDAKPCLLAAIRGVSGELIGSHTGSLRKKLQNVIVAVTSQPRDGNGWSTSVSLSPCLADDAMSKTLARWHSSANYPSTGHFEKVLRDQITIRFAMD